MTTTESPSKIKTRRVTQWIPADETISTTTGLLSAKCWAEEIVRRTQANKGLESRMEEKDGRVAVFTAFSKPFKEIW